MGKRKQPKGIVALDRLPSSKRSWVMQVPQQIPTADASTSLGKRKRDGGGSTRPSSSHQVNAPKKSQGMSSRLGAFTHDILRDIHDRIFGLEHDKDTGRACMACKPSPEIATRHIALYRCLECFNSRPVCLHCIARDHVHHPFHHIQKWTGNFFERTTLNDLDFSICLGHDGQRCPLNQDPASEMVVVHTNGVHRRWFLYCICKPMARSYDKSLQLIQHQLFSPTLEHPQTVFTFHVLKHFHRHSLSSKITPYDYFNALRKDTNAAFPQDVPDRYREFTLVMRLWRYLRLRRQSGQDHNIDSVLPHRRPGSLAVRCPACPEIGLNVDKLALEQAKTDKTHMYTLFLSADGNFHLQRKNKCDDPDDHALVDGNAYFVENEAYKEYLTKTSNYVDESTCAKLKAVRQQNKSKFNNVVVSRVVAIQCARHGFYLPQGMVDLEKGEAYARTDYALAHALGTEVLDQRWIMLSYDIWCQYSIKLSGRFAKSFPALKTVIDEKLRGAVPKCHISGHGVDCQVQHSFIYSPFSGMTCGEGIESAWAEQNHAAGSTKEQNEGHCHDTLDDFNGYWNWTKLHQLGSRLMLQYKKWSALLQTSEEQFTESSNAISPQLLEEWKLMSTETHTKMTLYEAQTRVPPRNDAHPHPLEQEPSEGPVQTGIKEFILQGLRIEELQAAVKGKNAEASERPVLSGALHHWRSQQHDLFPLLRPLPLIDKDHPEEAELCLPSSYETGRHNELGLTSAALMELHLRLTSAFDALANVRQEIHVHNYASAQRRSNPRGQKHSTRFQTELLQIKARQYQFQEKYVRAYNALLALGYRPENDGLQPLLKDQLWGKNMSLPHQLGDSTRENPWFWAVGKPQNTSEDGWINELERVRWLRDKAAIDRLKGEIEILKEEFRQTSMSFTKMLETWETLAKFNGHKPGYSNYAHRHAQMYSSLAADCSTKWQMVSISNCDQLPRHP